MAAYGIGILQNLKPHADIVKYLEKIDATLALFGGRFVVHGADPEVREGSFNARFIMIEFATIASAREWYDSPEYREIIPLRANHSDSVVFFVEGIVGSHAATDVLKAGVHYQA